MYPLFSFLISFSISDSYFSSLNFLFLSPSVSTWRTWVIFWYSWFTSFHFAFKPSLNSVIYYSERIFLSLIFFTSALGVRIAEFETFCTHLLEFVLWISDILESFQSLSFCASLFCSQASLHLKVYIILHWPQ